MDEIFANEMNLNNHNRNKSLDDRDLSIELTSPFNRITKEKSWRSTNSLVEQSLIINILDDETLKNENILKKRSPIRNDMSSLSNTINENTEELYEIEPDDIKKKKFIEHKIYISNLLGFFYYLFLTNFPIIIMNTSSNLAVVFPVDSFIFLYLSPIFYKLCFKNIFLYHYSKRNKIILGIVYPLSFILGICIRLLDHIPFFQKFVLNTQRFDYSSEYIALFWVLIIYMMCIFTNELYNTRYRALNLAFLIASGLFMYLTINFYIKVTYVVHMHHYFVGLLLHIVCQTKKSKISVINNAIGLGVFLEGISQWGFSSLHYPIPIVP